jgi:hypothetical protein
MKKLLIVVVILISGFVYWQNNFHNNQIEALYDTPYIVVYGRDSCGWSQKYLRDLKNERLKFIYKNGDNKGVNFELHPRMEKAGLDTRRYNLPVIDVSGQIFIRPEFGKVLKTYGNN